MQFSVSKNLLLSHLHKVSRVAPLRNTMPILSSILFELKDNKLTLRASDIELTMSSVFEVNGVKNGSVAIPSRLIHEIVSEVEDGDIEISLKSKEVVEIKAGRGKYEILGRPGEDFPALPSITGINTITLENKVLQRMIQKTIIAVSHDELKPALTGVLFQVKKDEIRSVATDSHRLVCIINKDFTSPEYEREIIIPIKFLSLVNSYLSNEGKTVLSIGENHVMVEVDSTVIYSRIIDEKFPDYQSVIPNDNDKILVADVAKIAAVLKRASIFSNKMTHQISLILNKEMSKVKTDDQEGHSSADESLDVEYTGEELTIGFNADYLREIIRNVDTQKVVIKVKTPISACLILPENQIDKEEMIMLLMPIRLSE